MLSPTGMGIRNDNEGSGEYGAPRGSRLHNGVDYECLENQPITAPFDMKILRKAYAHADMEMTGIAWKKGSSEGRMFYFEPLMSLINQEVIAGQIIGYAQSVAKYYNLPKMKNHIHFQINS